MAMKRLAQKLMQITILFLTKVVQMEKLRLQFNLLI